MYNFQEYQWEHIESDILVAILSTPCLLWPLCDDTHHIHRCFRQRLCVAEVGALQKGGEGQKPGRVWWARWDTAKVPWREDLLPWVLGVLSADADGSSGSCLTWGHTILEVAHFQWLVKVKYKSLALWPVWDNLISCFRVSCGVGWVCWTCTWTCLPLCSLVPPPSPSREVNPRDLPYLTAWALNSQAWLLREFKLQ